MNKNKRMQ